MAKKYSSKIEALAKKIKDAADAYYNGQPVVSDQRWDAWKDELIRLAPNHPALSQVGAPVDGAWPKVTHEVPMGSLNKVNTPDEIRAWARECKVHKQELFTTPEKLDGISVDLMYENGFFKQGSSRGDGETGQNITPNVRKMEGVKSKVRGKFTGNVRGEIVLRRSHHKKYFPEYANPRNAASGIATCFHGRTDKLTVIAYQVEGKDFDTEGEMMRWLEGAGFLTPNWGLSTIEQVIRLREKYQDKTRDSLDYEIDGLVIRINDRAKQLALGEKSHRPAGQMAFKFDAQLAETTINKIVWQVGDTGRITPVAEFDTVKLMGVKIKRASLYNFTYMVELGVRAGCKALIKRANDVIPRVEEVTEGGGKPIAPKLCSACGTAVVTDGEYIRCPNKAECPPQVLGRISKWVSEQGILEWGDKVIQRLIDAELVTDVADIYRLTVDDIAGLDRMGKRSAQVLIKELDKYRAVPLENFIGGLNIDGVATSTTKQVIREGYDTLGAMRKMTISQLEDVPSFGETRARIFHDGLIENEDRIDDILAAGVKIKARAKGVLTGKSFCFTGKSSLPRKQLWQLVEKNGGDGKKSVGRGLDFLVLADPNSTSSKAKAARKNNTRLLSEDEFVKMAGG
jgi:DNA ligase (NAD+)